MDHPIRLDRVEVAVRPWRTATLVVAGIAAVELVLLVMLGGALLAKPEPATRRAPQKAVVAKPVQSPSRRSRSRTGPSQPPAPSCLAAR